MSTPARRTVSLALLGTLTAAGLTACSSPPDPAPPAATLADALERGDLAGVTWADDEPLDLGMLGDLTELPRTVVVTEVGEPREDGDGQVVDVALEWAWDLDADGEPDWTYPVGATLLSADDADWTVLADTATVVPGLRPGGTLALVRTVGQRADVLDGDGAAIVTPRPVFRVGVDKVRLEDADEEALRESAAAVATLAGHDAPDGFADRVVAAGPRAFVEAIVVREGSAEVDLEAVRAVPGGVTIADELPLAPTADFARALLGRAGPATEELVTQSEGRVQPGDLTGLSGLQRQYDPVLAGAPGLQVVDQVPDQPDEVRHELAATDGTSLRLTLSVPVQQAAEEVLSGVDTPAGVVVLRASTGEVLAAASGPGSEGLSTATLASLAPGSTFKVVTALALMRAGVLPDDVVSCPPQVTVDGYSIANYPGYPEGSLGDITMTEAIAHSCNTALVGSMDQLSARSVAEAAESLGLGRPLAGEWPGFLGSVPDEGTGTAFAASLIGQGEVLASPLAMATVVATVAAGRTVTPTLLAGPAEVADDVAAVPAPAVPLVTEEVAVLRDYLAAVVSDGTGILLADVPGEPVHAKTGSAEAGSGDDARVDSWLVAYQGDLAVAALVQGGGHGAGAAGSVVEELFRALD